MLITLPDGSHRNVPGPENLKGDLDYLLGQRRAGRADGPVEPPDYIEVDLGGNLWYYRWELRDGRGNFCQDGSFQDNGNDFSDGDMIWDKAGMGRNSYLVSQQSSSLLTTPYGGRFCGDEFLGVPLMVGAAPELMRDNGGTDYPQISAVANFTRVAGSSYALCCKTVQINGSQRFLIGWNTAAANSLQVLIDLNPAGPAFTTIPTGGFEVFGLCQTPIDQDALVFLTRDAVGGIINRIGMIPALGSVNIETGIRAPAGGYTVGMVALEGTPDIFHVVPADGNYMLAGAAGGPWNFNYKGKLIRHDLRASYGPQIVKLQLPYVLWATGGANSIFYCAGGREHRFMTRGADIPVPGSDRPPFTGGRYKIICAGHHRYGDKFFWTEVEADQAGVAPQYIRRFEYDAALNRAWPVSQRTVFGVSANSAYMGGPDMPISLTNSHLIDYSQGGWVYQYQPMMVGALANEVIHVDGAGAMSGRQFAGLSNRTTPRLRPKGHHNPFMTMNRVTGPTFYWLRRGIPNQLTAAGIAEGLNPHEAFFSVAGNGLPETIEWRADQIPYDEDYRPVYINPEADDWQSFLQLTFGSTRVLTGTNAPRYTPITDRITVEGYLYDRPMPAVSKDYHGWGAESEVTDGILTT